MEETARRLLLIVLLVDGVLGDEFGDYLLHEFHHFGDFHDAAVVFEFFHCGTGVFVVVFSYLGDVDALVVGGDGVFCVGEDFFVEFFTWT